MRKVWFVVALIVTVLCVVAGRAYGQVADDEVSARKMDARGGSCGSNVQWDLTDATLTIYGSGEMMDYGPRNAPWYKSRSSVKTLIISNGVTKIGTYAFFECKNLTMVSIPDSVTTIGNDAFNSCYSLTNVTFGKGLTSIGNASFYKCYKLSGIILPNSVIAIGNRSFFGCTSLTSITIPDSVKTVEFSAFSSCTSLTSVVISKNMTTIEDSLFQSSHLTSVIIPDSVTSIRPRAFSYCTSLTTVTIPDSVTSIGEYAFYNCTSLTTVTIPDSVTSIGELAFYNCSQLTSVFYQGSIAFTNENASFVLCNSLNAVCVPPDYPGETFCGKTVNTTSEAFHEACKVFQSMFNHCYKGAYVNGVIISQKRKNATDYERLTGCVEYTCDNETGPMRNETCKDWLNCTVGKCDEETGTCGYFSKEVNHSLENHCYEFVCVNNEYVLRERENATNLARKSNACFEYSCDNETGVKPTALKSCNNGCSEGVCNETTGACVYQADGLVENSCYEVVCINNQSVLQETDNVKEWISRTNGCVEYQCLNDTGQKFTVLCPNDGTHVCVNETCISRDEVETEEWNKLILEMQNFTVDDENSFLLLDAITNSTDIPPENLIIATEIDDDGTITHVIILVKDKKDLGIMNEMMKACSAYKN